MSTSKIFPCLRTFGVRVSDFIGLTQSHHKGWGPTIGRWYRRHLCISWSNVGMGLNQFANCDADTKSKGACFGVRQCGKRLCEKWA